MKPTVADLVKELKLNVYCGTDLDSREITVSDINRPALEVAGYFTHYPKWRVQVIGQTEHDFFSTLSESVKEERAQELMQPETPAFILARDIQPSQPVLATARRRNVPLLGTKISTTRLISRLGHWLDNQLAPRKTIHGVFVELFGVGVLITGKSGIGKSETAMELIKRGHRLVADDAVEIRRPSEEVLVGASPAVLSNMMELRGVGIIDVCRLYGAAAVRPDKRVELILHFEHWVEGAAYDRLGFDGECQDILGVKVPFVRVPVAPGRNLAMIVETAAINFRAKAMGLDVAAEINQRITDAMNQSKDPTT
ncbi:MAG: HPr(Ser) kinase/phosphatase [Firmicutes bacterium]|nr:HPr(Ser) kinase/phosphatase [Bacillota bacterium]